jgi:hypothetical protein
MSMGSALAIGALVGLHVATWGAYKDSPFEGFRPRSNLRSLVLATVVAVVATVALRGPHAPGVVVGVGLVYAVERLATEWWKAILREDDQSAYTIPMRLGCCGRPVDRRAARYAVGFLVAGGVALAGMAVTLAQRAFPGAPPWLVVATAGAAGGWATAVGGAWKDAPVEGFSGWKFLRSPAVATAWAVPLSLLTTDWFVLLLAAAGFAVASIETYKTFLTGGRAPGKFAGQSVRHRQPVLRQWLAMAHAALWAVMALTLVATLAHPVAGLTAHDVRAVAVQLPAAMLDLVAMAAGALALLVTGSSTRLSVRAAGA